MEGVPIFVVGEGPCNDTAKAAVFADLERKLWESILGSRYFGLQQRVGRERASDFVAFDVSYVVPKVSKTAPFVPEMSVVL